MKAVLQRRILLLGFASWLLPFVVSVLFFDQTGHLLIAKPLFKSIMVVVGGGIGAALLVHAFTHIQPAWQTGLALGLLWLAINLILDIAILIPMSGMTFADYVMQIGVRYLLIPIMAVAIGYVAGAQSR